MSEHKERRIEMKAEVSRALKEITTVLDLMESVDYTDGLVLTRYGVQSMEDAAFEVNDILRKLWRYFDEQQEEQENEQVHKEDA